MNQTKAFTVLVAALVAGFALSIHAAFANITLVERDGNSLVLKTGREIIRLTVLTPTLLRVQATTNNIFRSALMVEAGFVKTNYPPCDLTLDEQTNTTTLVTRSIKVVVTKSPFSLEVQNAAGTRLFKTLDAAGISVSNGARLDCELTPADHFFGFGYMRKCSDARGSTLTCTRNYRNNEATVPFFMNPRGYAFLSINTWKNDFDFTKTNSFSYQTQSGDMDFFLMVGSDFKDLLNQYTDLTGKPQMAPEWALGFEHRCQYFANDKELLETARLFRQYNIPCDLMALEPGWEEMPYSMQWIWSTNRFPDPRGTIRELKKMGYKFDLWESGEAPMQDLLNPKVRAEWFAKRTAALTNWGVDMFKQDDPYPRGIKSQMMDEAVKSEGQMTASSRASGEILTVANSFYSQTAFDEWRKLTGRRPVIQFHAYNASIASQRWPYEWAGDFGTGWGLLNASLSGHALCNSDARDWALGSRHMDFFMSAGPVNDCWAYTMEPWNYPDYAMEWCRMYASLRFRLYPYFYTAMREAHETGLPIMRPMVLMYPEDPQTYKIATQFFIGDSLLVAATVALDEHGDFPRTKASYDLPKESAQITPVYLPKGTWIDYWTGNEYVAETNGWIVCQYPFYAGGPLLVKAGAIIPTTQVKQYLGQTPDQLITLDIYPGAERTSQRLYEDDGISFGYEQGKFAYTEFSSVRTQNAISIRLGQREGDYPDKPAQRDYLLKVHSLLAPASVVVDGKELSPGTRQELLFSERECGWYYDADANKIIIKLHRGWKFSVSDKNPAATYPLTPAEETVIFQRGRDSSERPAKVEIVLNSNLAQRVGRPSSIVFKPENTRVLADGHSAVKVAVSIQDENGNRVQSAMSLVSLALKGGGSIPKIISLADGVGTFEFTAPAKPCASEIYATGASLPVATLKLNAENGTLRCFTNPTKKVPLNGKGDFRGKSIQFIVSVRDSQGNRLACQSRVHLAIRDYKNRETLDLDSPPMFNGEVITGTDYKTRPEKFLVTATADGLEPLPFRCFANAWDLPDNYLEVKDGMLPLIGK